MEINADKYTPVDETLIPLGENALVDNTPFDFRKPKAIGRDLDQQKTNTQLKHGAGYDHNWVLNRPDDQSMAFAARVTEPISGRVMEIYTQEPDSNFTEETSSMERQLVKMGNRRFIAEQWHGNTKVSRCPESAELPVCYFETGRNV